MSKVDLLFMIDSSLSMADKQELLAEAVPLLFQRLVTPDCVDEAGSPSGERADAEGNCETGTPEFPPVTDLHVGIVTSSLGDHGSNDVCSETSEGRTPDDHAQLLGSVRANLPGNENGFLTWAPGDDAAGTTSALVDHVTAAGELGCGYESTLEAWYRFLIDPEPVDLMDNDGSGSVRVSVNETVLQQRAAFLRQDSLLVLVMLSDENDCSIMDENAFQGWLVGYKGGPMVNTWRMPVATASCADPNSACCRPCISAPAPGCPDNDAEGCPATGYRTSTDDSMNLRCFRQRERFGIDLLYPTSRYVDGLTETLIDPRMDGTLIRNPLFAPDDVGRVRPRGRLVVAGLLGVPWQDIATDGNVPVVEGEPQPPNSLEERALVYMTAAQLEEKGRWDIILGEPEDGRLPADPLMIESIAPRAPGTPHPLGLAEGAIAEPGTFENAINGHEQVLANQDDLQFACIFPLRTPVPCSAANAAGCDCNFDESSEQSPLCEYETAGSDGVQHSAKAYPSLRQLEVLRGLGPEAFVGSICPKHVEPLEDDPASDPFYGYNPAMTGILELIAPRLRGSETR